MLENALIFPDVQSGPNENIPNQDQSQDLTKSIQYSADQRSKHGRVSPGHPAVERPGVCLNVGLNVLVWSCFWAYFIFLLFAH